MYLFSDSGSNNNLKTTAQSFKVYLITLIVASLFLLFDIIQYRSGGMRFFVYGDSVSIGVFWISFFLFKSKVLSLESTKTILFIGVASLSVLAIVIPDTNQDTSYFYLAALPAISVLFLGAKRGDIINIILVVLLFSLFIASCWFHWLTLSIQCASYLQIFIAFTGLSYVSHIVQHASERKEATLQNIINRRGTLLRELHHRSKNNLQVVMGFLESQAIRSDDPRCLSILLSHRARLKAMSLIHENLKGIRTYERIQVKFYLENITKSLASVYDADFDYNIADCSFDFDEALNIGLFYNEALSNAMKHAYENAMGPIRIRARIEGDYYVIRVQDEGKGFDPSENFSSMGLTLMEDITEFFEEGTLTYTFEGGTTVEGKFYCLHET